jgi:arabinose-5-phosphate isomerase
VRDIMHTDTRIPKVRADASLRDALMEISGKGLGMTTVVDARDRLLGIFTDGDLRRTLNADTNIVTTRIDSVMTRNPRTCPPGMLAAEALALMEERAINALAVIDEEGCVVGALNTHDLLRAGVA